MRQLALTLGNTAQATSTVLAVFLGGLAIGAYLSGKFADRSRNWSLAMYGYVEFGVAISALAASEILKRSDSIYLFLYHHLPADLLLIVRFAVAVAVLLMPTILMGATLPTMIRYLQRFGEPQKTFSYLYGINTLGAAAGGLAACFLGFAYIGVNATVVSAAVINCALGIYSLLLAKRLPAHEAEHEIAEQAAKTPVSETPAVPVIGLAVVAFMTGATALSYEVLWTRMLRFFLTSVTYSFSIMIGTFLFGLAIGSFLYERVSAAKPSIVTRPYLSFAVVQLAAAAACAGSLFMVFIAPNINAPLHQLGLRPDWVLYSQPAYQFLYIMLVSMLTILPAAVFIGMLFPMIGSMAASRRSSASTVGIVYAWNTVGCVVGSLVCGFFLMPAFGSYTAFQIVVWLSVLTAGLAALTAPGATTKQKAFLTAVPVLLATLFMLTVHIGVRQPATRKTLVVGEDYTGAMIVFSEPQIDAVELMLNGSCLASTTPPARRYMRLLGHLPVLLQKDPQNVLVACFGTGTTCGAVALHPEVKHVDLVELSRMVLNVAPFFHATNFDVLKNPKVSVHVNDVRNFLLTSDKKYDVITFEPPPPSDAGIVSLYTKEFYQLVDRHLSGDGVVCQWMPMDQASGKLWKMMVATARSVFPYVSVWIPNTRQAVILASNQPINLDYVQVQNRIDESADVRRSLKEVGLDNAMAVLSTFVVSGKPLDDFLAGADAITDDNPSLEFFAPHAGRLLREIDVEAAGIKQVADFIAKNAHADKFNAAEFSRQWQAVHALRQIDVASSDAQSQRCIDYAVSLVPESHWLDYVKTHAALFYRGPGE